MTLPQVTEENQVETVYPQIQVQWAVLFTMAYEYFIRNNIQLDDTDTPDIRFINDANGGVQCHIALTKGERTFAFSHMNDGQGNIAIHVPDDIVQPTAVIVT